MLNLATLKNLTPESYNLLNIEENEDRPYFFGLGFPSRFNCNSGFSVENFADDNMPNFMRKKHFH